MSLYAHTLLPEHVEALGQLFRSASELPALYKRLRLTLEDYVAAAGRSADFNYQRTRRALKEGRLPADLGLCALLYDYAVEELPGVLRRAAISDREADYIRFLINSLEKAVSSRIRDTENPFLILARDLDGEEVGRRVPDPMINDFFGYRRSANLGEVVRFHLSIERVSSKNGSFVRFVNNYSRGMTRFFIRGGGIYSADDVLYLFGRARGSHGESAGYRTLALRQLGNSSVLCGPLISYAKGQPIAARVVLVPWSEHIYTIEQQKMNRDQLIKHMIEAKVSDNYQEFISEVKRNTSELFGQEPKGGLFYYISNATETVIKSDPGRNDTAILAELESREIQN